MSSAKTEAEKLAEGLDPAAVDRIASEILAISDAANRLLKSSLQLDTLALLISETARPKVSRKMVRTVLLAASRLHIHIRPEPVK